MELRNLTFSSVLVKLFSVEDMHLTSLQKSFTVSVVNDGKIMRQDYYRRAILWYYGVLYVAMEKCCMYPTVVICTVVGVLCVINKLFWY